MSPTEATTQDARAAERARARNTWIIIELRRGEYGMSVWPLLTCPAYRVPGLVIRPVVGMPYGMTVVDIPPQLALLMNQIQNARWCGRSRLAALRGAVAIRCVAADDPAYAHEFDDGRLGYDGLRTYSELHSPYWKHRVRAAFGMKPD